jgi:uncharacterized ubiquitin-like protein YukD
LKIVVVQILPVPRYVVSIKRGVSAYQRKLFDLRLSHQQPVKWVAVVQGE